jgi:hypothetical protein
MMAKSDPDPQYCPAHLWKQTFEWHVDKNPTRLRESYMKTVDEKSNTNGKNTYCLPLRHF